MLQTERWSDGEEALRTAMEAWQRKLWTALPGIVQGPPEADGTISVAPAIKAKIRTPKGVVQDKELPVLIKVPLQYFGGGGFSVTVPIVAGDEVLVIFASRCIDGWWQSGGVQAQIEIRLHHLSDGFALPGFRSVPRALANVSTDTMQIRSDDGLTYLELADGGIVNVVAPGGMNVTGNLNVSGEIVAGAGTGNHVSLRTHTTTIGAGGGTAAPNHNT